MSDHGALSGEIGQGRQPQMLMRSKSIITLADTIALISYLSIYFAAPVTAGAISPAVAQQIEGPCTCDIGRLAFDVADTDGNGLISESELTRDAAVGFASLDKDGGESLTPQELGPHDSALFARIDTDGDGVLTFSEVMTNKVRAFDEGDKNEDGGRSFQEMVDVIAAEEGARS